MLSLSSSDKDAPGGLRQKLKLQKYLQSKKQIYYSSYINIISQVWY